MSSLEPHSRKVRAGGQQAAARSQGLAADISELIRPAAASRGFDMEIKNQVQQDPLYYGVAGGQVFLQLLYKHITGAPRL